MNPFPVSERDQSMKNLNLHKMLEDARALVARGFCKRRCAANSKGITVKTSDSEAVSFDILGALKVAACWQGITGIPTDAIDSVEDAMGSMGFGRLDTISGFTDKDRTTQRDAIDVLDTAIGRLFDTKKAEK